ncbi:Uu.00g088300.m01.CDS01 [Anthostomella pinea]|uniref:Uu.00g088300.m01.CDS01 n=1 Tax=Anthostomella pinea TaxID=933095 RepID=A0AAI8VMH2_9PEZI|nr:Uu.00g088300.m01.CDS01 [Anthostomella pinea]
MILPKFHCFLGLGLLLLGAGTAAPAESVKVWVDTETCGKYDGLQDAIRKAFDRVSIRAYYARNAMYCRDCAPVEATVRNILGTDDLDKRVSNVQSTLKLVEELAGKEFSKAKSREDWSKVAMPNDITIYCSLDHLQDYNAIEETLEDKALRRICPKSSDPLAFEARKPGTRIAMITGSHVPCVKERRLSGFDTAPEYIAFTDTYRNTLHDQPNWGLLASDAYDSHHAGDADWVEAQLRKMAGDDYDRLKDTLTPMDTLSSLEHLIFHELMHTAACGHLVHGRYDAALWKVITNLKITKIDPSKNNEAIALLAHALEMMTRLEYRTSSEGYVFEEDSRVGIPDYIPPPAGLSWD